MTNPILQLRNCGKSFFSDEVETKVLKNIDLSIFSSEMVAIVGASGSGKSTLMNILGCLDRPSTGTYTVSGHDVQLLDNNSLAQLRRERFGFVFQRYHLMPHLSAVENVEIPALYAGTNRVVRVARARDLLTRLGLGTRTEYRPGQLSGGQQQRVSIARALINGGQIILADEPTGALDSESGEEVIAILRELHARGHTVIIVTHNRDVAACAERIIEIADGEIVDDHSSLHDKIRASSTSELAQIRFIRDDLNGNWTRFSEAFRMAWRSMLAHRMRTVLTMLGIIIGIASVVSIIAIGDGATRYVLKDIRAIGTNTLDIYPGKDFGDDKASSIRTLVSTDLLALKGQPYVDSVTPMTARGERLRYRNIDVSANAFGVGSSFFQVRGMKMASGSSFNHDDVERQAQVVVIDQNTQRKLFGTNVDPIGKVIVVGAIPCSVIGVVADKKNMSTDNKALNLWLPYSTAASRLFGQQYFDAITVRIQDGKPTKAAEAGIVKLLTQLHHGKDFFAVNMDSVVRAVERTSQSLTLLLSTIAVISLVVGGIGVMNIMLVSVTERTQEIGIRMAVGARQGDVLQQFLTEAVLMCLVGGGTGILLSYGVSGLFSIFVKQWQMVISATAVTSAFIFATLIGMVCGYWPARNAARLDPIEALARE